MPLHAKLMQNWNGLIICVQNACKNSGIISLQKSFHAQSIKSNSEIIEKFLAMTKFYSEL